MFTGIIEEIGNFCSITPEGFLKIEAKKILSAIKTGDSIAVNGVCLTVTAFTDTHITADVMPETLRHTNLGTLKANASVNLERAMPLNGRFGGHIVSGHIDGTGTVQEVKQERNAVWFCIQADQSLLKYIIKKESVALDGISLTVADSNPSCFWVSIIPHTLAQTALATKKTGAILNIETDILAKYIEKLIQPQDSHATAITMGFLENCGF